MYVLINLWFSVLGSVFFHHTKLQSLFLLKLRFHTLAIFSTSKLETCILYDLEIYFLSFQVGVLW